jgi:hypothetical protein
VALAREKAEAIRQLVRGEGPRADRILITPKTFKVCMDGFLNCLLPPWQERPETADRLRSRIQAVINYAIAHEWGWQSGLLKRGKSDASPSELQRGHYAALAYPYERDAVRWRPFS